jgi:hypothetical protein
VILTRDIILIQPLVQKGRDVINASWWLALTRHSSLKSNNCNALSPARQSLTRLPRPFGQGDVLAGSVSVARCKKSLVKCLKKKGYKGRKGGKRITYRAAQSIYTSSPAALYIHSRGSGLYLKQLFAARSRLVSEPSNNRWLKYALPCHKIIELSP